MPMIDALDNLPEIQKAVEADLYGQLIEMKGDLDGEPIGALVSYMNAHLDVAGVNLGLGHTRSMQANGQEVGLLSFVYGETIVSVFLGPNQSPQQIRARVYETLGGNG